MEERKISAVPNAAAAPEAPAAAAVPDHSSIAALAYQLWLAKGCPIGSDQDDWFLAESMLKSGGGEEAPAAE
jgi:hypothetical protein